MLIILFLSTRTTQFHKKDTLKSIGRLGGNVPEILLLLFLSAFFVVPQSLYVNDSQIIKLIQDFVHSVYMTYKICIDIFKYVLAVE